MLSLSRLTNALGAAKYFSNEDNYYLSELGSKELSSWWGKGADILGLKGKIEQHGLEKLLSGELPNGQIVGLQKDGTLKHRAGYDLCVSAPKSVSILALEAGDSRFYEAHKKSVDKMLSFIERDCAQVRTFAGENIKFEATRNLVVAKIEHGTSRKTDPQMHTHCLVMNLTQRQDGQWRALASSKFQNSDEINGFSERVFKNHIYYGLIYRSELAKEIKKMGFDIEISGPHGMWELKGFSREAIDVLSKRRAAITAELNTRATKSLKAADVITLDSRDKKQHGINFKELQDIWSKELSSVGFSSKEFLQQAIKEPIKSQTEITGYAKEAIQDSIEHLSKYDLKLDYSKILERAMEFSIGKTSHAEIVSAFNEAVKTKELIPISTTKFVTQKLLENEKQLMDFVANNKGNPVKIKQETLNILEHVENKEMLLNILQAKERLSLVEHQNGNYQDFIKGITNIAEKNGKTVRILMPNKLLAHEINQNMPRASKSLWQWLLGRPELGESVAGFNFKYKDYLDRSFSLFYKEKDVIIVDEAQKLGNEDMRTLLSLTEKSKAKVIFLNNSLGNKGYLAGNPIEILKQAEITKYSFLGLDADKKNNKIVTELKANKDEHIRCMEAARLYAAKTLQERSTAILASSKAQAMDLNKAIREELKNNGQLGRVEHSIEVLNPAELSQTEKTIAAKYNKGMIVRFYENGYVKDWQVTGISKERNIVFLEGQGLYKKSLAWNPKKDKKDNKKHEDISVFKKEELSLAIGDKIITTSKMHDLNLEKSWEFTVENITEKNIILSNGQQEKQGIKETQKIQKTRKISLKDFQQGHFTYNYCQSISSASKKPNDNLIVSAKAYSLDKTVINELETRVRKNLTIFTDDAEKAEKSFDRMPVKSTATETVISASNIDRIIDDNSIEQIKADIQKAIVVLDVKEKENQAEKAVNFALEKITAHNAGFTHKELICEALVHGLKKGVSHEELMSVIADKEAKGELIMGRHFNDGTRWTTKEALELEKSIIGNVKNEADKVSPFLDNKTASAILDNTELTVGQKDSCHLITTTKDRFVMVQGFAGTGKTTTFTQVKEMIDKDLLALAPTHQAVKELKNKGIEARTLKSFLVDVPDIANKLVVLDEASMVSNKDFAAFVSIIKDNQGRAVISGDIAQHIAIESGKPFEVLQKSGVIKTSYLTDIVRQKNPILKEAVEDTIQKNYSVAFAKINAEDPGKHITRTNNQNFFDLLTHSVIEVDNKEIEKAGHQKSLEDMVAEDYLSRGSETRTNTAVIVHANADRVIINDKIRAGLKDDGSIMRQGLAFNQLISKGLTDAEHKDLASYNQGDIVKLGKEYFFVKNIDDSSNSVLLVKETREIKEAKETKEAKENSGLERYFYPEKYAAKQQKPELYTREEKELCIGDIVRFTKTDKERNFYANFEYQVKDVGKSLMLENKQTGEQINLNPHNLKDAHWDYAYTITGYGAQGSTKPYVIDYEVSYRKNLANQRSFYIAASRAQNHLTIYTDNKNMLLDRIIGNKGDKYSALEVIGQLQQQDRGYSGKEIDTGRATPEIKESVYYDAKEVSNVLKNAAEYFTESLLGKPNARLSSSHDWRYGNKGSLSIKMDGPKRGIWHNFETGESGDLLKLLQIETGMQFTEALKFVMKWAGRDGVSFANRRTNEEANRKIETDSVNKTSKTNEYMHKIASEAVPIQGTIAEEYLKNRGILNVESDDIRFHPHVYSHKEKASVYSPALVALGRNKDRGLQCMQVTYLDKETAKKADFDVQKRTYCSPLGASVKVNNADENATTFIAEGLETALSIKDVEPDKNIIATLGKSNYIHVETQNLGQKIVLCLDNDGVKTFTDSLIHDVAKRLQNAGKDVYIAMPEQAKTDFNDIANQSGNRAVKDALDKAIPFTEWVDKAHNIYDLSSKNKELFTDKNDELVKKYAASFDNNREEMDFKSIAKELENDLSIAAKSIDSSKEISKNIDRVLEDKEREIY